MTDPLAGFHRVLFVHAHPDDESLATGGTIAALRARGADVLVVTCSRGEAGEVVTGPLKAYQGTPLLAGLREAELARALAALGAGMPRFLGESAGLAFSDSGMRWGADGRATAADDAPANALALAPPALLVGLLGRELAEFQPDLVVGYDLAGGYGHPDHVRATLIARGAAAARGIRFAEIVEADAPGAVAVPIDLAAKRRALAAHESQLTLDETGYTLSGGQHRTISATEHLRFVG